MKGNLVSSGFGFKSIINQNADDDDHPTAFFGFESGPIASCVRVQTSLASFSLFRVFLSYASGTR